MHRRAGDLHAIAQRRLVDPQSVHPLSAKRRDQRGMHIQYPLRPPRGKRAAEDPQKARQHDHLDVVLLQQRLQALLKVRLFHTGWQRAGRHAGLFRPLQRVSPLLRGDHQRDLPMGQLPCLPGVQQRLQIGAAAGNQHGDPRSAQHSATFSSPGTISPITAARWPLAASAAIAASACSFSATRIMPVPML